MPLWQRLSGKTEIVNREGSICPPLVNYARYLPFKARPHPPTPIELPITVEESHFSCISKIKHEGSLNCGELKESYFSAPLTRPTELKCFCSCGADDIRSQERTTNQQQNRNITNWDLTPTLPVAM
jgi:hypothetical protein